MSVLRFAIIGAGFWANYQLAAWKELDGAECIAVCDRSRGRAEALALRHKIERIYDDAAAMFTEEKLDFVDIITEVDSHSPLVHLAAGYHLPVICQKPMAPSLEVAEQMLNACSAARVPLFIHENWRWQTPIRQLKDLIATGTIGNPVRCHFRFVTGFDFLENQPGLRDVPHLLLADLGVHILDTVRFFFGEVERLYCQTHRVHTNIRGEDVGTIVLKMKNGMTVVCELAYAGIPLEQDHFPQTTIFVEGSKGSAELAPDYWIRLTTGDQTLARRYPPPSYLWSDPAYAVVHSSLVPCNASFLRALQGVGEAETTGEDQLRTARLVFAAYESARRGEVLVP